MAPRLRAREVSPVELAKVQLARIEALNPQSNAYYTVFEDTLRADTERTEREIARGDYRGPLHCVPVCIKDIYESGRTTCDSKPYSTTRRPAKVRPCADCATRAANHRESRDA